MKKSQCLAEIYMIMCMSITLISPSFSETQWLTHNWYIRSSEGLAEEGDVWSSIGQSIEGWISTSVPNTVLAVLEDAGVYPNLYYGTNLKSVPGYRDGLWLIMPEDSPFRVPWWYRTEFEVPANWSGKEITLHLDGINYEAEVWLNGKKIADKKEIRGMFRRFELLVTSHIRFGAKNGLALKLFPPGLLPDKDYNTKQIEATTGWDDHNPQPPDRNLGIWQPVYLKCQGPIALRHPYVESEVELPSLNKAKLTVSVWVNNLTDKPIEAIIRGTIEHRIVEQQVQCGPWEKKEVIFAPDQFPVLQVDSPRIWWPHPLGPQELYSLQMEAIVDGTVSDSTHTQFGIRHAHTELNEEDWRVYYINGAKILIRGGAWMTCDMLLQLTRERYESLIRFAREAGLNMLRSEGFSIRETDLFYDLCDEYGVMVTQQIFGRSIFDEELAIKCIEDMLLRIRNHPSLVHFLGHDETFPTDTLDKAYQDLIQRHRIHRTYQPHSGAFVTTQRLSTGGTRTGTRELWTYAGPSHYYLRTHDGAWGFAQSGGIGGIIAPPTSLRQMMPEHELWPPLDTESWSFHTVVQGGSYFYALREAMNTCYGPATDLNDFIRKVEAMNYNSARGMFEAYGRNKYSATGITTWKYNAAWPAGLTWHYIDWYLRPTSAYYAAKKACEPLHIQYAYDDECVWLINNWRKDVNNLRVKIEAFDLNAQIIWTREIDSLGVTADGKTKVTKVEIPQEKISPMFFLSLTLSDTDGNVLSTNTYWLSEKPDIPGTSGHNLQGIFYTSPKSSADFKALNTLDETTLEVKVQKAQIKKQSEIIWYVKYKNVGPAIAFLIIPEAYPPDRYGYELPRVYWSEGGFILRPNEEIVLTATIPLDAMPDSVRKILEPYMQKEVIDIENLPMQQILLFGARSWNAKVKTS